MQHIKYYSNCFFCEEPVLTKRFFVSLNNVAICENCCLKIDNMRRSENVHRIASEKGFSERNLIIAKFINHAEELDW